MEFAPPGIRGLFIAGLFAAAMSTLDSSFNSFSAVTLRDVLGREKETTQSLWLARGLSLLWGVLCTAAAFFFARSSETVIESINRVGSLFYGPVMGLFLLGMLSRRASERAGLAGLGLGLGVVLLVWLVLPRVSWMWWNPIGFLVTFGTGWLLSRRDPLIGTDPTLIAEEGDTLASGWVRWSSLGLAAAFLVLVILGITIPRLL
jgi:SSS family solute:Na+ symporter